MPRKDSKPRPEPVPVPCSRPRSYRHYVWSDYWRKQFLYTVQGCYSEASYDPGPGVYVLCAACQAQLKLGSTPALRACYPAPPQDGEARIGSTLGVDVAYNVHAKPVSVPA